MTLIEGEGEDQHPDQREEIHGQCGLPEETGHEYQSSSLESTLTYMIKRQQFTRFVGLH